MIDDCHSTGFLGRTGRGTPEHCDTMGRVDIITELWAKPWVVQVADIQREGRKSLIFYVSFRPYLFSNTLAQRL